MQNETGSLDTKRNCRMGTTYGCLLPAWVDLQLFCGDAMRRYTVLTRMTFEKTVSVEVEAEDHNSAIIEAENSAEIQMEINDGDGSDFCGIECEITDEEELD